MSILNKVDVSETVGTAQVCAELSTHLETEVDIPVSLATNGGTGMCVYKKYTALLLLPHIFL